MSLLNNNKGKDKKKGQVSGKPGLVASKGKSNTKAAGPAKNTRIASRSQRGS